MREFCLVVSCALLLAGCQPTTVAEQGSAAAGTAIPSVSAGVDRHSGSSADRPNMPAVATPKAARVSIAGQPSLGSPAAAVTVVEFMDYECPFCRQFARRSFPQLRARYIDTGQVRWVSRNLPLPRHTRARPAAIAARCAGEQGRFWEMHDALLTGESRLGDEELRTLAQQLGLDLAQFSACLGREDHAAALEADIAIARGARIRATPSFVVGRAEGDVVVGQIMVGDKGPAAFDAAIAPYLQ